MPALAQQVIDGGAAETVNGAGGGTHPSPWNIGSTLEVGRSGTGTLTVANVGVINVNSGAGTINFATNAGSTGTLNIGAAAGNAAAAAGTLNAANVDFGAGTGKIVFNHTDTAYIFAPTISGAGSVEIHSGTTIFNTNHAYSSTTTVNGGELKINGSIVSTTTVIGGDVLSGTGTLGDVFIASGGTLAPGNSIGTLNVGSAALNTGSSYDVEIDNTGASDLINAAGTVTIQNGVTMNVTNFPVGDDGSAYNLSTDYTVITAAGGVTGTFDTITDCFLFLDASASYDANNVCLRMVRNGVSYASVAITPNQVQTATAIGSIGLGNALYNSIFPLNAEEARGAFDALSGEVHPSVTGQMIDDSRVSRSAVLNRINGALGVVGASSIHGIPISANDPNEAVSTSDNRIGDAIHPAFWIQATWIWGDRDAIRNQYAIDRNSAGALFGVDGENDNGWLFAVLGGYGQSHIDIDALRSQVDVESFTFGAYGGTRVGELGFIFGDDYTWHSLDTARAIVFPGFTDRLTADYSDATSQIFAEVNYRFEVSKGSIEGFTNIAHVRHEADSFTERGGVAALTARSSGTEATFTTIGLRAKAMIGDSLKLHGSAVWRHDFDDTAATTRFGFVGSSAFTITGMPIARDSAILEIGLSHS